MKDEPRPLRQIIRGCMSLVLSWLVVHREMICRCLYVSALFDRPSVKCSGKGFIVMKHFVQRGSQASGQSEATRPSGPESYKQETWIVKHGRRLFSAFGGLGIVPVTFVTPP